MADGAGISLNEAYILQLRAELAVGIGKVHSGNGNDECTAFAVLPKAAADVPPQIGQNADLPAFYTEIGVIVAIVSDDDPRVLMPTSAGQVSSIGINDRGLGVFANHLTCDGWRLGSPRDLLSRLALTKETGGEGIAAVRAVPRASSRNLLMLDVHGTAADLETTPTRDARLDPEDRLLAHANHYVAPAPASEERSPERNVANSRVRLDRMNELLRQHRGSLDAEIMQSVLRDRDCTPDALCRLPGDDPESDFITFASVIAEPARSRMAVAVGPPNENPYREYAFSGA